HSRTHPLGCGQVVRRLTLDQEIEGSNPSAPAKPQDVGLVLSTTLPLVVFGPISVLAEEDESWLGHLTRLICGHLIRGCLARGHLTLSIPVSALGGSSSCSPPPRPPRAPAPRPSPR